MSCLIQSAGNIIDIPAIRRYLFPTDDNRGSDNWLQICKVSVSPIGDIIVITNERRMAILSTKWDTDSELNQFQISYSGSMHENDNIKAVLCLPVINNPGKSSRVVPEWTCIIVGFESGIIHFYTETGQLLFKEQLHNETIINIKCQSQHNPRPDMSPDLHQEEIYILYQSLICVIAGNQLFPILRKLRDNNEGTHLNSDSSEPIPTKKWGFQDQATITDVAVVGINLYSTFDHLLTTSTCNGFDSKYRSSVPYNSLLLATGSRPFLGYHYALDGCPQPIFSDVAKAVANKLKSALPSWLVGGSTSNNSITKQQQSDKQLLTMQAADLINCRFGLCDLRRIGLSVILSPDHKLAVITDTLGRVLLIDSYRGIILKILKGYRAAQCSFIQVPDERHSKHRLGNKVALFLIIYSSKKGIIEIFTTQKCLKIATFSASKYSRLIYINCGLMGFNTTTKSRYKCQFNTILLDNDGQLKEILIPFHYALNEKSNIEARDIYLYKKLKKILKLNINNYDTVATDISKIYTELNTYETQLQTLELLLNTKKLTVEILLNCVNYFLEKISNSSNDDNIDNNEDNCHKKELKTVLENSKNLINFYLFLIQTNNEESNNLEINQNDENKQVKTVVKNLDTKDFINLQTLFDLQISINNKKGNLRVNFNDLVDNNLSLTQFLSVFDLKSEKCNLKLIHDTLDDPVLFDVSKLIYDQFIIGNSLILKNLSQEILQLNLSVSNLLMLLINYWINRQLNIFTTDHKTFEQQLSNVSSIIYILIKLDEKNDIIPHNIREILLNSSKPFPSLVLSILFKIVIKKIEFEEELIQNEENELDVNQTNFNDFDEILTPEYIQWSILIGKLEDISLLNIILNNNFNVNDCNLPKLNHDRVDISLKYILSKGRGSVTQLVAKWLTLFGINPENIVLNERIYNKMKLDDIQNYDELLDEMHRDCSSSSYSSDDDELPIQPKDKLHPYQIELIKSEEIFIYYNSILKQFPYSLQSSRILSNMCWEYALVWQKDIQSLVNLEASIKCLNTIPNPFIKKGLFNLVWNTHLKILFENTCKLINKVGKLPKERLCKQDTGLNDRHLVHFLNITTIFLNEYILLEKNCLKNNDNKYNKLTFEQVWQSIDHQPTLTELALQQQVINYDLLLLHYQLSLILYMLTSLSIKYSRPIHNLFDNFMLNLFFIDFQTKSVQINCTHSDIKIQSLRVQFLLKIIKKSIETITKTNDKLYMSEHIKWMTNCLEMGELWNLDKDILRHYETVQMYTHGFDSYGDQLYGGVNDRIKLGPELIAIAGKRLSQFLDTSPNYCQNVTLLTTSVTNYMKKLNDDWCAPGSLKSIDNLVRRGMTCINDKSYEYKIGEMLLDGCQSLRNLYPDL